MDGKQASYYVTSPEGARFDPALLHESSRHRTVPCTPLSAHRVGLRTTQVSHPIEQRASQRGFPFLGRISLRPQSAAEALLESEKGVLRVTLSVVTRRSFPCKPTLPLDGQKMLIALRG